MQREFCVLTEKIMVMAETKDGFFIEWGDSGEIAILYKSGRITYSAANVQFGWTVSERGFYSAPTIDNPIIARTIYSWSELGSRVTVDVRDPIKNGSAPDTTTLGFALQKLFSGSASAIVAELNQLTATEQCLVEYLTRNNLFSCDGIYLRSR